MDIKKKISDALGLGVMVEIKLSDDLPDKSPGGAYGPGQILKGKVLRQEGSQVILSEWEPYAKETACIHLNEIASVRVIS